MATSSRGDRIARIIAASLTIGFGLLTSFYLLLVFMPYTYGAFIRSPFLSWMPWFVHNHHVLMLTGVLLGGAVLWRERNLWSRIWIVALSAVAIVNLHFQFMQHVRSDIWSYAASLTALLFVGWFLAASRTPALHKRSRGIRPRIILEAAMFSVIATLGSIYLRGWFISRSLPEPQQMLLSGWSLLAHGLFAVVVAGLLVSVVALMNGGSWKNLFGFGIAVFMTATGVYRLLLVPLGAPSHAGMIYAALLGLVFVLIAAKVADATTAHLPARSAGGQARLTERLLLLIVLVAAAYVSPIFLGTLDWNFMVQNAWMVSFWTVAAAGSWYAWHSRASGERPVSRQWITAGILALIAYQAGNYWVGKSASGEVVESYANFDGSFRLVRALLAPPHPRECDDFCEFLHQYANIRTDANLRAPDTELAPQIPITGHPPNIFIIVVDSLRPDYLSPYNAKVDFTPNIQAFAKQASVIPNAFARYSGTALSEPSIWSGVAQPHQQFAQPFPAINSLEKLLDRTGYQKFVSVDTVLRALLRREPNVIPLAWEDSNWSTLEFCPVLPEAKAKLAGSARNRSPVFFYSQPIDVHQVVLSRKRISGNPYPGFDATYASALQRFDQCFGEFMKYLEQERLLANSIVILTADHGDALGDNGRHGHSHGIFPEMLRIPLIIRLPEQMRAKYTASDGQIAFTIDLAPTLLYLLGQQPIKNDAMFGRPLLTSESAEQRLYERPLYLVSSDAAPVFGLLGKSGETLYIADAVNHREYWFDLNRDPTAANNLITPEISRAQREILRAEILKVAKFYSYTPPDGGIEAWLNR